ncbi:MAG: hypothetical protein K0Q55_4038, partial [Verrucomicrobia bacterium]|nr:hypothetical protein [Verrucomicrobiota bacterium]
MQDDQPPPIDPLRIWGVAQWCFCDTHVQVNHYWPTLLQDIQFS